jgi:sarcosine/dimethylglycine N-methyltransferase
LARFELESLGTVNFYRESAKELGWRELEVIDLSGNLVTHYERLLQELERRHDELLGEFREEFLEGLRNGMQSWVTAGKKGNFKWAMFHYQV